MPTAGMGPAHDQGGKSAGALAGSGVATGEESDATSEEGTETGSGADLGAGARSHTDTAATADSGAASEPAGDGRRCDADETP